MSSNNHEMPISRNPSQLSLSQNNNNFQNSENGNDIFSDDFFARGGLAAFANNRVNFTNLSATVYYQLNKNFGISTLLTQTLDGRNVRKEKGLSIGLVYSNK